MSRFKRWRFRGRELVLGNRPALMGIINVTPDSFSDGGSFASPEAAARQACRMLDDGATIIDIGGESTRPGAKPVAIDEECRRVVPVIEALRRARPDCAISVDTRKVEVAEQALDAGADIVNDVSGGQYSPKMPNAIAARDAGWIVMHARGTPETMRDMTRYDDLFGEIRQFLSRAAETALAAGLPRDHIALDPGIGFGKTADQNIALLAGLALFRDLGYPVLIGPSRKSFIGALLDNTTPQERDAGTLGSICWCAAAGADVVRVHDVKASGDALTVFAAISRQAVKLGFPLPRDPNHPPL